MTDEEKALKKDVLYCLDYLQNCVSKMVLGQKISAVNVNGMMQFGNELAIVISKCKKADFIFTDK